MSLSALLSGIRRTCARSRSGPLRAHYATKMHELPPWSPARHLLQDLEDHCPNPLFSAVKQMGVAHSAERNLGSTSAAAESPSVQKGDWDSVMGVDNFWDTIRGLRKMGVNVPGWTAKQPKDPGERHQAEDKAAVQPPTWLVMHILYNQADTYHELLAALRLMYYHLPAAPPELKPSILLVAGIRLAERSILAPFRQLVRSFLGLSDQLTAEHFNLMIRTVSLFPASNEASVLCVGLVKLAVTRNMKLTERTYDALLSTHFADPGVEQAVLRAMDAQDTRPTLFHIQQLVKMSSAKRRSRQAARYIELIRERLGAQKFLGRGGVHPSGVSDEVMEYLRSYVASMRDSRASFRHLRAIARGTKLSRRRNATGTAGPLNTSAQANQALAVEHWTAGLLVGARDKTAAPASLLKAFREGSRLYGTHMCKGAYIVVIRGLLRKWAVTQAVELWNEYRAVVSGRKDRLGISNTALGAGVAALTLHGEPHLAFELLETVAVRQRVWEFNTRRKLKSPPTHPANVENPQGLKKDVQDPTIDADEHTQNQEVKFREHPTTSRGESSVESLTRPWTWITIQTINQFMMSLHRTGRADIVFALWDKMRVLYRLDPDVYSLNILLQAARWSMKYNITIRGALAHFGVGVPVERATSADGAMSRDHAKRWIEDLASPNVKHVRHSLWNGELAPRCALRIAARVILGNWPHIRRVQSPVPLETPPSMTETIIQSIAMKRSDDLERSNTDEEVTEPNQEISGNTTTSLLVQLSDELPDSVTFMGIIPTDITFRAILDLSEALNIASEVPLVMAWMRTLNIRPSKSTLATALVYWSGVPDVDRWGGRQHSYRVFYGWLLEWIGEANMPTAKEMSETFRRMHIFNVERIEDRTAAKIEKIALIMQKRDEEDE